MKEEVTPSSCLVIGAGSRICLGGNLNLCSLHFSTLGYK